MKCLGMKFLLWISILCLILSVTACAIKPVSDSSEDDDGGCSTVSTTTATSQSTNMPMDTTEKADSTTLATDVVHDASTTTATSQSTNMPMDSTEKADSTTLATDVVHDASTNSGTKGSSLSVITTTTTQVKTTIPKPVVTDSYMLELALNAYTDLLNNWWIGDAKTGHFIASDNEPPSDTMWFLWEHAMAIFALDSLYKATGYKEIYNRIVAEWEFIRQSYPSYIAYVHVPDYFHYAQDDAGWNAMLYMLMYEYTGDAFALDAAGELIHNSYEHWKNGDLSNGLLYAHDLNDKSSRESTIWGVNPMLAAFDYLQYREDEQLLADTITLYNWFEENMLRDGAYEYTLYDGTKQTGYCDDMLYWGGYQQERAGHHVYIGPGGAEEPYRMEEANSSVCLGGTTAMAILHMRMYDLTGEKMYQERAQRTMRAIFDSPYLVKNGVFVDAGDGWTNAAFMRQFVTEVMTLPELQQKDVKILNNTAHSIYGKARTHDGYYSASWSGPAEDADTPWGRMGWTHDKIMTNATSVHMIIAAALAESMGLSK